MMDTTRLRARRLPGHVETAIRDLAMTTEHGPAQILGELTRSGETYTPDIRTVRSIVKEARGTDGSGDWSAANPGPVDVRAVLPVLRAVIERTDGRRWRISVAAATWIVRLRAAAPDLDLWATYVLATFYAGAERKRASTEELDALVAFAPWRGPAERDRYLRARAAVSPRMHMELLQVVPDLYTGPEMSVPFTPIGPDHKLFQRGVDTWQIGGRPKAAHGASAASQKRAIETARPKAGEKGAGHGKAGKR